jgi:hypothetical protein
MKRYEGRIEWVRGIWTWVVIAGALFLSGCGGLTYAGFAGADWPMPYNPETTLDSNGKSVAITVEDRRPYIVSGDKAPTFIGLVRAGFGIPYNTTFEPVEVVAEKIKRDIAAEASARGYEIGQGDYTMDVLIREFKHDGYTRYTIFHNLEVTVSHEGQERTTTIEDKRSGKIDMSGRRWGALLADYYSTMIQSIVATLENN